MSAFLPVAGAGVIVALLAASAFFSSSETAIFSLPREWIEREAATGDDRARALKALHDDPHRLLVTLLVGNNVVNVALSSIVTVLVATALPPGPAVVAATLVTSALVLVFGEIVPKAFGLENARQWALTVAGPVGLVGRALSPLITLFDWITRHVNALLPVSVDIERPYTD